MAMCGRCGLLLARGKTWLPQVTPDATEGQQLGSTALICWRCSRYPSSTQAPPFRVNGRCIPGHCHICYSMLPPSPSTGLRAPPPYPCKGWKACETLKMATFPVPRTLYATNVATRAGQSRLRLSLSISLSLRSHPAQHQLDGARVLILLASS
ncbi:hypothetical protein GQ53DRAFT_96690 [Thozetella sp. PMI_491]|nr:hypothetical protein GQ53DRAFT_96690 [Thozetella sp. PMI_491]